MKKAILFILLALMLFGFSGCSDKEQSNSNETALVVELLGITDLSEVYVTQNEVDAIYDAKYNGKYVLFFIASDSNQFTEVVVYAAISVATSQIVTAKVIGHPSITTHGKDNEFSIDNLGLVGLTNADNISSITAASVSSNSVKKCLTAIFNQFYSLTGNAQNPSIVNFVSIEQDLKAVKNGVYNQFIAKVKLTSSNYNDEEITLKVSFEGSKATLLSSDKNLTNEESEAIMKKVKKPTAYITELNAETRTFVVDSHLAYGGTFTLTVVLNEDNTIADFSATSTNSNPSFTCYWQDFDSQFINSIEGVVGQNVDGDAFAAVNGATVSTNTFKAALDLIAKYCNNEM